MRKNFYFFFKNFFFFSLLFYSQASGAAGELFLMDVRSFSLGNVHALSDELLNPAGISFSEQKQAGISISNRFQMKELNTANLYLKYPNKRLDAGIQFSTFGYEDYRIIQSQVCFAKKLTSNLSLGVQLAYLNESSILEDNSQHYLTSGLGFYFLLNEQISLALLGENLLHTFDENRTKLYAGLKYKPSGNTVILLETSYDEENRFRFSVGLEYEILDRFIVRSGFQSNLKTPSFGIAYKWNKWTVETGFSLHSVLGINSMAGVSLEF
jgi:long-subunit fatty acid transport protein